MLYYLFFFALHRYVSALNVFRYITVRTAVARFESTWATPTLARSAVAAAKRAESRAHPIQLMC